MDKHRRCKVYHKLGCHKVPYGSPILFLFFNADLVQRRIDCYGGAMASIDDFTAWATGPTAENNCDEIEAIIETALDWERRSGATFEADKTAILHFARKSYKSDAEPFAVKDRLVQPKTQVKVLVLGVIMDAGLNTKNTSRGQRLWA
ncbi:hypothetical protein RJ55_07191 [Drechmeria coniospora]|nr:hypothetical protein RJ55_07191 [Drechmeria coniospora]